MPTVNFYLYDRNSQKDTLVLLRFRYNNNTLVYSTRQKVNPTHWYFKKQRAKEIDKYKSLNELLNKVENDVMSIYRNSIVNEIPLTNDILKNELSKSLQLNKNVRKTNLNEVKQTFFDYLDLFISESETGIRLQKNGKIIQHNTIKNYKVLRTHLKNFVRIKKFKLELKPITNKSNTEIDEIKNYWKDFYLKFTNYLYYDKNSFDNSVGTKIKFLRTFCTYLIEDKNLNIGNFHKMFYTSKEKISIIVISTEQLKFLINDDKLNNRLPIHLQRVKDIFIFGCTVALRVSDLLSLTKENLEINQDNYYLKVKSKKTNTFTQVKLPEYAVKIIKKYENQYSTILPKISSVRLNIYLKDLTRTCGWTKPIVKVREKRGEKITQYKDDLKKTDFQLCDLISTHTMRRTAITTMLRLGLSESIVREISGHSPASADFYKYVELSRSYINTETDIVFKKLSA